MRWVCLLLLAAGCWEKPMSETVKFGTSGQVTSGAPLTTTMRLVPGAESRLQWDPADHRVCDLELRLHLQTWPRADLPRPYASYRDPLLSYRLEVAHGRMMDAEPPTTVGVDLTRAGRYDMPARGAVKRITARELNVFVRYEGMGHSSDPAVTPFPWVEVIVSVQPVTGPTLPAPPLSASILPGLAAWPQNFPPEAKEWRLVDRWGRPYAAATGTDIVAVDALGRYFYTYNTAVPIALARSSFADWQPIPPRMRGWGLATPGISGYVDPTLAAEPVEPVTALYR
jgi:hypothetical protein